MSELLTTVLYEARYLITIMAAAIINFYPFLYTCTSTGWTFSCRESEAEAGAGPQQNDGQTTYAWKAKSEIVKSINLRIASNRIK